MKSGHSARCGVGSRLAIVLSLLALLFGAATGASAKTYTMPSMNQSNMLWAAANAVDGDVFNFPPGVENYSTTGQASSSWKWCISWNAAVTLNFVAGQSIIRNVSNDPFSFVFSMASGAGSKPVRVSGLTIDGQTASAGIVIWGGQKNVRIDHCVVNNCVHRGIEWWGYQAYGVVDHCSFTNCEQAHVVYGNDNQSWATTEGPAFGLGTTNGVYVEDSNIVYDQNSGWLGSSPLPVEHGHGARVAYRKVNFISQSPSNLEFFDSHGNQLLSPGDHRASIWTVLENNNFYLQNGYLHVYIRGGSIIMISNVMTGASGAVGVALTEEEDWRNDIFNPLRTTWPAQDQITNSWFVNNTINGKAIDATYITNNVRSPIGSSAYGYAVNWADLNFIKPGRDFFVTNNSPPPFGFNHPTIPGGAYGYTPLQYPHPLVSGSSGTTANTNPVIAVTPSSRDFGSVNVGSQADMSFTIQNIGGGTLAGAASVPVGPFSIVSGGTYSLGSNATQTVTVRFKPSSTGSTNQTISFTGGGGTSVTVSGRTPLGTSFNSSQGAITAPFAVNGDGSISQSTETLDPTQGGSAVYDFVVPTAGNYSISASVNAPHDGANSIFIGVDAQPVSPTGIWDMALTSGFQVQPVILRGNTTAQQWSLSAGSHQLIIRGREAGVAIGAISIAPAGSEARPSAPANLRLVSAGG